MARSAWRTLIGDGASGVGTGLTLPFAFIYLDDVQKFSVTVSDVILATAGEISPIGNPAGGWLSDRFGARPAIVASNMIAGTATAVQLVASSPPLTFLATLTYDLGVSMGSPTQDALLAEQVSAGQRPRVFAISQIIVIIGLGSRQGHSGKEFL
ncbi:MFS transporter [Streptomyces virginiae]|uniref:MFS transporter n=1 Tax=Streptomyces virginiae TaxID=1961 RepID=UPI000D14B436